MNAISKYAEYRRIGVEESGEGDEVSGNDRAVRVCIRKRPIFKKEIEAGEFDVITCLQKKIVIVHDGRMHADCRRQLMNHHEFQFNRVFDHFATNDDVFEEVAAPLVNLAGAQAGFSTCMMYGQTGSGKTYTMSSIYERASREVFRVIPKDATVSLSFIELAGDKCHDLLNGFFATQLLTGQDGCVYSFPVVEPQVKNTEELTAMINHACAIRQTAATGVHDASSRSHAILRIFVQHSNGREGVLTLVDLAGSEHRIDSMHHTKQRRKEGAQINASLAALKSIVLARAAGKDANHIYRKSKLTMVLKSSFMLPGAQTVVIATASPSSKDTEHSLNTLRHACIMDGQNDGTSSTTSESAAYVTGGKVIQEVIGEIDVVREARRMKAQSQSDMNQLNNNGNTFGSGTEIDEGNSIYSHSTGISLCKILLSFIECACTR